MSATIYYEVDGRAKVLPVFMPSAFQRECFEVFEDTAPFLTRDDLHSLYNLADTSGANREAFKKLIEVVRKHGEVSLEVEY